MKNARLKEKSLALLVFLGTCISQMKTAVWELNHFYLSVLFFSPLIIIIILHFDNTAHRSLLQCMSSFISFNTYSEIGWVRPALLLVSRVFVQTIGISSNQDNKYYVHNGESFIFIFDGSLMHTQHIHTQINKAHWSCNTKYLFWIFLRTARADGVVEANYGVLWSHCQSISWYKSFELEWRVCASAALSFNCIFFSHPTK